MVICIGLNVNPGPTFTVLISVLCSVDRTVLVANLGRLVIVVEVVWIIRRFRLPNTPRVLLGLMVKLLVVNRNFSTFGVRFNALTCLRISGAVRTSSLCRLAATALLSMLLCRRNGSTWLVRLLMVRAWT